MKYSRNFFIKLWKSNIRNSGNILSFQGRYYNMKLSEFVKTEYGKSISECTNEELYYALLTLTKKMASGKQHGNSKKNYIIYPQNS